MGDILENLKRNRDFSHAKSYFIGLERGRIWAENYSDYVTLREWSELDADEFDDLVLPEKELSEFELSNIETPLEWKNYLKGWLEGVKEIRRQF